MGEGKYQFSSGKEQCPFLQQSYLLITPNKMRIPPVVSDNKKSKNNHQRMLTR